MKIGMVNGSPKNQGSASRYFLDQLGSMLENPETAQYSARMIREETMAAMADSDVLLFAFPLYADGLPSHLVSFLLAFEAYLRENPPGPIRVYTLVNCGFFEGEQTRHALDVMENFCIRTGLIWQFGLGIGAGPFFASSTSVPWQASIKRPCYQALVTLKESLEKGESRENLFVTAKMPRAMYMLAGNMGWRMQAKQNGLKTKDLKAKL